MNENIVNTLEQYVTDVNPQYAILLSGSWGCGKTHFIEAWCAKYIESVSNKNNENKNKKYISPIKVSLFGTSSISDVYERIRESLNPNLFKIAKLGGKVISAASKAFLSTDLLEGSEVPIETNLAIWDGFNKDIKGCRLFIIDDLERSRVSIVEILGLVDMFLNVYNFHVIIIGDERHLQETAKTEYNQYKEKIIGQTLVVEKDSSAAFDTFTNEIESISKNTADFVRRNKECVLDTFNASDYSNLRSLRQALHQFTFLFEQLNVGADDYKCEILANYIAISMELHNNPSIDLNYVTQSTRIGFMSKNDVNVRLQSKYQFIEGKYNVRLFSGFNVIYLALKYGIEIVSKINVEIDRINNKPLYDTYKWYYKMSNSEFTHNTNKVHDYLAAPINNLYDYLVLLYFYCQVQYEGLISIDEDFVNKCIDKCINMLNMVKTLNDFVPYDSCIAQARSSTSYETQIPLFEKVKKYLRDSVEAQKIKLKDNLTNILENLSNDKIESFKEVISGADPYNHADYNLQSIFDKINANDFVKGYLSLSNENKDIVRVYIENRYERLQKSNGILKGLSPDKDNLQVICDKLKEAEEQLELIDKLQVNKFITMLENAIAKLNLVAENLIEQTT